MLAAMFGGHALFTISDTTFDRMLAANNGRSCYHIHVSEGEYQTVLGLIGDTARVDMDLIESLSIVDSVKSETAPFKSCNRKFHPDDKIVQVGDVKVGGGNFCMIAGPCSVESEEQIVAVAKAVKASGANMLRGGAFKPRTSPYEFKGLKAEGIELLKIAL